MGLTSDEAREAYLSGNFDRMLRAVSEPASRVNRHFLLMLIVNTSYEKRADTRMRSICRSIGVLHIKEMGSIIPALKSHYKWGLPRISTFQHLAAVYAEDGDYDLAIEVCRFALSFNLTDDTKSGYAGRIKRIEKMRLKNKKT
jgi:hypothetical protein